jgi:SAM-dependent methyltransferase
MPTPVARALLVLVVLCALPACARPMLGLDVPFRGTPPAVVDAMLRLAEVRRDDVVYDLGSGDGRIPIAAARDYGAHGVGFDIDPHMVDVSRENAKRAGVAQRVRFEVQDIFTASFADATVVALYLSPEFNLRLRPRLQRELKPGARIVSQRHDMGDWRPARRVDVTVDGVVHPVYLWVVGSK